MSSGTKLLFDMLQIITQNNNSHAVQVAYQYHFLVFEKLPNLTPEYKR